MCGYVKMRSVQEVSQIPMGGDIAQVDGIGHFPAAVVPGKDHLFCGIGFVQETERDVAAIQRFGQHDIAVAHGWKSVCLHPQIILVDGDEFPIEHNLINFRHILAHIVPQQQRGRKHAPQRKMRAIFIYGASSADLAHISLAFEAHNHHIGIIPCAMADDRTLMRSFGLEGPVPNILADKNSFRAVILISYLWKSGGFGTIVCLVAIAGIDQELYEAAQIDGAGRWRQLWHITLSSLRSTIVVLLIFRVGEMMYAGFDQIFAISNYLVVSVADIIDTYVYRLGMESRKFSEATAAGLFQSAIGLVLVLVTNYIAKKIDPESGIM